MIYSDAELQRWWDGKSRMDKEELLDLMLERSSTETFTEMVEGFKTKLKLGGVFIPKQLQAIRKWDR